jgi:hypothetical protein
MARAMTLNACLGVVAGLSPAARPAAGPAQGQPRELHVDVTDPRPVAAAIREIERHFGRVVTYEDISYVAPSDIVDVTGAVRRDGRLDRRVLGMRGGSIDLVYKPTSASIDDQLDEVLAQLVTEWNGDGHSGVFRTEKVAGGHHVVPIARKGRSENVEAYASPLEARITIPYESRSGVVTLDVLAQAISASAGRPVFAVPPRGNLLVQARLTVGAQNQTAREVLWEALQAIDRKLSWQMLCSVGDGAECAINVYSVRTD